MFVFRSRASAVLYDFLMSLNTEKVFLIPCNICPIVPLIFLKANIKFEFIDISNETLCLDLDIAIKKIKRSPSEVGGILFVHTYGLEESFDEEFKNIKNVNDGILIIDDKCLCIPSFDTEDQIADLTLYSTGYSKYIDLGFGGYGILSSNKDIKHNSLKFNQVHLDDIVTLYKYHVKEQIRLETAVIENNGNWLENKNNPMVFGIYEQIINEQVSNMKKHKNKINEIYSSKLPKELQLPDIYQNWRFNILIPRKEEVLNKIFEKKLFASSHYSPLNKVFSIDNNGYRNGDMLYSKVINLFNDKYITEQQAVLISEEILNII